jgi:hypothetical protein
MKTIKCPECQNIIQADDSVEKGKTIDCSFCGAELRIVEVADDHCDVEVIEEEK